MGNWEIKLDWWVLMYMITSPHIRPIRLMYFVSRTAAQNPAKNFIFRLLRPTPSSIDGSSLDLSMDR